MVVTFLNGKDYQKILLEKEGVKFVENIKVDLKKYLWKIDSIETI